MKIGIANCEVCNDENETQLHIIECKKINQCKKEYEKPPE